MPEETMEKEFMVKVDEMDMNKALSQMEMGKPDLIEISRAAKEMKPDYWLDNEIRAAQFKTGYW